MASTCSLVVLARSPHPGTGKTRLRAALRECDSQAVDALVRALLIDTLAWASLGPRPLVLAARGDRRSLSDLAPGARRVAQPRTGLGGRIEAAIAAGVEHSRSTIQIGSDSPTLPAWLLDDVEAALVVADCALVPAEDGGWVALGSRHRLDGVLLGAPVRWSSPHAAADTVAALERAGLDVARLSAWYDVDDAAGLARLLSDPTARLRAPLSLAEALSVGGEAAAA